MESHRGLLSKGRGARLSKAAHGELVSDQCQWKGLKDISDYWDNKEVEGSPGREMQGAQGGGDTGW